jgi:gliding motility-associated-like protein
MLTIHQILKYAPSPPLLWRGGWGERHLKPLLTLFLTLLVSVSAHSQSSASGKDFWLAFSSDVVSPVSVRYQIRIVTEKNTQATITFTKAGKVIPLSLPAGAVYTYCLTEAESQAAYASYETAHIQADQNISVYALSTSGYDTDVTAILPTAALGISYYYLSYSEATPPCTPSRDCYTIVSTENNTTIYEEGIAMAVLNKGEVYSRGPWGDGSGRHITADHPVAFFVTRGYVNVPSNVFGNGWFYQQLYPESLWGNRFFVPVTIRGIERVRIIASQDNTIISLTGGTLISGSLMLNKGEWTEIEIYASENGCYIETGNPVGVASYLTGSQYPGLSYSNGEPSMVWIPPVEQSVNESFAFPFSYRHIVLMNEHHALIVVPSSAKDLTEIKRDNGAYTALTGGAWHDHSSGYSYYTLPLGKYSYWDDSSDSCSLRNPKGLIVLMYGLGFLNSYYYVAASSMLKSDVYFEVNDIHHQLFEGETLCNEDIEVKATVKHPMDDASGHLRWLVDDVEQASFTDSLQWTGHLPPGKHTIRMIAKNRYGVLLDSITTSFVIGEKKETIINDTICQNDSYNKYGFSLPVFMAAGAFDYRLDSVTVQGCDSIVLLNLTVNPVYHDSPVPAAICPGDSIFFGRQYHKQAGIHIDTLKTGFGCDSIITLNLSVLPPDTLRLPPDTIIAGNGYNRHGFNIPVQYATGMLNDTLHLKNHSGCDSTVILYLEVVCPLLAEMPPFNDTVCQGESYSGYGFTLPPHDIQGDYTYRQVLTGAYSCDSIVTLRLTVKPAHETAFTGRIPVNEPYNANGFSIPPEPEPGFFTFEKKLNDRYGCDSVVTLHLTIYAEIIPDYYFSPNGDGVNDVWNIKNIEYFEVISVEIYDRSGKLLVRYTDHFTPWDGVYRGRKMPSDDYWYIITLKEKVKSYMGHFTLMR